MILETIELKKVVKKLQRVKESKVMEISKYISIKALPNCLEFTKTDGTNYVQTIAKSEGEAFSVIVNSSQFCKIVEKTKTKTIELKLEETSLIIVGHGVYHAEILSGESYPMYADEEFESIEPTEVKVADLLTIESVGKAAVSQSSDGGQLRGYLLDSIGSVTTDGIKVACNTRIKFPKRALLPKEFVQLLGIFDSDAAKVYISRDGIKITDDLGTVLMGSQLEGISRYPDVSNIVTSAFDTTIKIDKSILSETLDRMGLFISPYDANEAYLLLAEDTLQLESFEGSVESLDIKDGPAEQIEVTINVVLFKEILSGTKNSILNLSVREDLIKIEEDNTTLVFATSVE